MRKISRSISSGILLIIYCSYMVLSCSSERDNRTQSIQGTIDKIKERLHAKNYTTSGSLVNPNQDLKKEIKRAVKYFDQNTDLEISRFNKARFNSRPSNIFKLASVTETQIGENTFGVDDYTVLNEIISGISSYYSSTYSTEQVSSTVNDINSTLLNYTYSYAGADQFLSDQVSNGNLSAAQSEILRSELYALVNATTVTEVTNILNVVNEEVILSQLSSSDKSYILEANAALEGFVESESISKLLGPNDQFHLTTGAEIGFGVLIAGVIIGVIAAIRNNDSGLIFGGLLFVGGTLIANFAPN